MQRPTLRLKYWEWSREGKRPCWGGSNSSRRPVWRFGKFIMLKWRCSRKERCMWQKICREGCREWEQICRVWCQWDCTAWFLPFGPAVCRRWISRRLWEEPPWRRSKWDFWEFPLSLILSYASKFSRKGWIPPFFRCTRKNIRNTVYTRLLFLRLCIPKADNFIFSLRSSLLIRFFCLFVSDPGGRCRGRLPWCCRGC